jgi:CheY-like chemotaxis protein
MREEAVLGRRGRKRVLVCDDRPETRQALIDQLGCVGGFVIDEATNGRDALRQALRSRPHLILMDMHMPVMDGYDAIRAIRAQPTDVSTVPIIALTNGCVSGEIARCARAGASDYMTARLVDSDLFRAKVLFWSGLGRDGAATTARDTARNARTTADARLQRQ